MRDRRLAIAAAAVVLLTAFFLIFRPDENDDAAGTSPPTRTATTPELEPQPTLPAPTQPQLVRATITVRNGRPAGGLVRIRADKDMRILIVVRSDVSDHVHVHGYDVMRDVAPGSPATIRLRARLVGRFEIELEDRQQQIAQLTVTP